MLDQMHHLDEWPTCQYHEKEGARCRRSLHARVAVDQHGMTRVEFTEHFVGDFRCPCLHIIDFSGAEIVIYGNTILMGDRRMKRQLLRAIKDGLDTVFLEPRLVLRRLPPANPHTGYDFIGVFIGIHATIGNRNSMP